MGSFVLQVLYFLIYDFNSWNDNEKRDFELRKSGNIHYEYIRGKEIYSRIYDKFFREYSRH